MRILSDTELLSLLTVISKLSPLDNFLTVSKPSEVTFLSDTLKSTSNPVFEREIIDPESSSLQKNK